VAEVTNHRHLTDPVMHYTPEANGRGAFRRIAVCGVETEIAGPYRTPPEAIGASLLALVTCCLCLDVIEARKRIGEAGE
jgi:hypothetical protein